MFDILKIVFNVFISNKQFLSNVEEFISYEMSPIMKVCWQYCVKLRKLTIIKIFFREALKKYKISVICPPDPAIDCSCGSPSVLELVLHSRL